MNCEWPRAMCHKILNWSMLWLVITFLRWANDILIESQLCQWVSSAQASNVVDMWTSGDSLIGKYKKFLLLALLVFFILVTIAHLSHGGSNKEHTPPPPILIQLSKKAESSTIQETSKVKPISAVQRQRLDLVNKVCQSYRDDHNFKNLYVDKPGSKIRGKFTLEPKSKLVMCNVMKQGRRLQWCLDIM